MRPAGAPHPPYSIQTDGCAKSDVDHRRIDGSEVLMQAAKMQHRPKPRAASSRASNDVGLGFWVEGRVHRFHQRSNGRRVHVGCGGRNVLASQRCVCAQWTPACLWLAGRAKEGLSSAQRLLARLWNGRREQPRRSAPGYPGMQLLRRRQAKTMGQLLRDRASRTRQAQSRPRKRASAQR